MRGCSWGMVVFNGCVSYVTASLSIPCVCVCHQTILGRPSSITGLWTKQEGKTKAMRVGKGVQVLASSVKPERARPPHITVPWHVSYHVNSYEPTGKQQDAFSLNQLNFQPKYNLRIYIPLHKIDRFTQTGLRATQKSTATQEERDTDQQTTNIS
jgi:hypothetical protein